MTKSQMQEEIIIYTDGACLGNPGPGGFGWVILFNNKLIEHSESNPDTTNNRMEISAIVSVLEYFDKSKKSDKEYKIIIHTDSELISNAINKNWLSSWSRNGWRKVDKQPVKNQDLWERLWALISKYNVDFVWVKAHIGNEYNEKCDKLATTAAKEQTPIYHKTFNLKKSDIQNEKFDNKTLKTNEIEPNEDDVVLKYTLSTQKDTLYIQQINKNSDKSSSSIPSIIVNSKNVDELIEKLNQFKSKLK